MTKSKNKEWNMKKIIKQYTKRKQKDINKLCWNGYKEIAENIIGNESFLLQLKIKKNFQKENSKESVFIVKQLWQIEKIVELLCNLKHN